ncbi:hypothetical protein POTOM_042256 [Populus tomentosa]|uniref:Uncharacterized protein n=1 Tax=Populus tomentosa TaxID=118781 RepID=A0A8X8C9W0_POPTO|nr:hypothetical protein POTOM_042256 [Populus tomentosa]
MEHSRYQLAALGNPDLEGACFSLALYKSKETNGRITLVFDLGALWLRETMGEGEVGTGSAGSNGEENPLLASIV